MSEPPLSDQSEYPLVCDGCGRRLPCRHCETFSASNETFSADRGKGDDDE